MERAENEISDLVKEAVWALKLNDKKNKEAAKKIWDLVSTLMNNSAPDARISSNERAALTKKEIAKIDTAAQKLLDLLVSVSWPSDGIVTNRLDGHIIENAPRPDDWDNLTALKHMLDRLVTELKEPVIGPRRGAPGDLFKMITVERCYNLFDYYCPGKASTHEGGKFATFVQRIYEAATGNTDVSLEHHIKVVVSSRKKT